MKYLLTFVPLSSALLCTTKNFSKRIEKPLLTVLKPFTVYFKRLDSSTFTLDAKNHITGCKILRERRGGNRSVIKSESDRGVTKTGGVGRVICQQRQVTQGERSWGRFSKVAIINGLVKPSLFTCKIEVLIVLHLNMIKLPVNAKKWSTFLATTRALILFISIWIFDFGPETLPGVSRNGTLDDKVTQQSFCLSTACQGLRNEKVDSKLAAFCVTILKKVH